MTETGFYRPPNSDEEDEDEEEMDQDEQILREVGPAKCLAFSQQISLKEYEKEKSEFTKAAVDALLNSPEYQSRFNRCGTCWSQWLQNHSRDDCMECAGFALSRPCPICNGKCKRIWKRDVEMSHSMHEAHWLGECGLPWEERKAYMMQTLMMEDGDAENLLIGMNDLAT